MTIFKKINHKWWGLLILILGISIQVANYKEQFGTGKLHALALDKKATEWIKLTYGSDPSGYLQIGDNISEGRGFSIFCDYCKPPQYVFTDYWGPGAPVTYALVLSAAKYFQWPEMEAIFWVVALLDIASSIVLFFFALEFVTGPIAIYVAAICLLNPLVRDFLYSSNMTASESTVILPLSLAMLFTYRGFKELKPSKTLLVAGFFWAWVLITRDSNFPFLLFLPATIFLVRWRTGKLTFANWKPAVLAVVVFLSPVIVAREALKTWHYKKGGLYMTQRARFVPSIVLFSKYEGELAQSIGFGMGDYLDPEIARKVREAYDSGQPNQILAYKKFLLVLAKHPWDALVFKAQRLPMLIWGAKDPLGWGPFWTYTTAISIVFYFCFVLYIFVQLRRRSDIPEILYAYPLFIVLSFALIHAEFRYSYPALFTVMLSPALLLSIYSNAQREKP